MLEALKQIRDNLVNGWRNSSPAERIPYLAVIGGFVALVIAYGVWMSQPTWVFLMQSPDPGFANRVTKILDDKGIEWKVEDGRVYVHTEREKFIAQGEVAGSGLTPGGGGFGWEIFLEPKLGTTGKVLKIQERSVIRSQIERTLAAMDPVNWAMVQFDIPEENLFRDGTEKAVASVTVETHGRINPEQVRAIQNVVATADASLDPDRVRVVDTNLNLLSNESMDPMEGITSAQLKTKLAYERQLEEKAVHQLTPIVGFGKARVKVDLDLDFQDREVENREVDPDSLVPVMEEIVTEDSQNMVAGSEPGLSANLGEDNAPPPQTGMSMTKETMTTTNKVSERTTVERIVGTEVKRLSVSVVVDGKYADGGAGEFQAWTKEELDQIRDIVSLAVGFQQERDGAKGITVACVPFQKVETASAGIGGSAMTVLRDWRSLVGPILILVIPLVCYMVYKAMEKRREEVRQTFQRQLESLIRPLEEMTDDEDISFGVDMLRLPEEERRTYKMQQKLVEYAKKNPKDFAQVLKAWIRE